MRVSRKNFQQLMAGSLTSLPTADSLSKGVGRKVLILEYPPAHPPGLGVILLSTHTKEKVLKHLLAKWAEVGFLRKSELLIGAILIATFREGPETLILDWMISHQIKNRLVRLQLWQQILPFVNHLPEDPLSYLNAFEPEILILKKWMDRKRFPAKAYIGIGHKSSGTLSTTLAWQEQMVGEEQVEVPSAEVKLILSTFVAAASPS
jgi:hypothetical protein